ncbi:MAG: hypothetical protein Q7R51_00550 [bacterium]|nr:hypothetical protein [bacterium]
MGKDDFIFLRRDVTMEKLFNLIFLGSFCSLFFSRLFYGFFHSKGIFINPLVFLLFPYFPGLSLLGGLLGAGIFLGFLATRKKKELSLGRMADFFSISFLITLPIGFLGYFILSDDFNFVKACFLVGSYIFLFVIFLKFLLPQLLSGKLKEGTITFLFLISFSGISLISNAFPAMSVLDFFKNFENLMLVVILIVSAIFLIRQEGLLEKIKNLRGRV